MAQREDPPAIDLIAKFVDELNEVQTAVYDLQEDWRQLFRGYVTGDISLLAGHCRDCHWWGDDGGGDSAPSRVCRVATYEYTDDDRTALIEFSADSEVPDAVWDEVIAGYDYAVRTAADFGCTHFEQR